MSRVVTTRVDGLADALGAHDRRLISLVGGGGKTSALFALGRQLAGRVVLTTTTKMGSARTGGHDPLLSPDDRALAERLGADGTALVWRALDGHRALGVDPADCDRWRSLADHVVVEADGSRQRPVKAPAAWEPVVPDSTDLLVVCVGSAAFGRPVGEVAHRSERVAAVLGASTADCVTPERLARLVIHRNGGAKGRPDGARFVVLLNRVDATHAGFVAEFAAALDAAADAAVAGGTGGVVGAGEVGDVEVVAVEPFDASTSPERARG